MVKKDTGGAAVADPPETDESEGAEIEAAHEPTQDEVTADYERLQDELAQVGELKRIFTKGIKGEFREKLLAHIDAEINGCFGSFRDCKPSETPHLQGRLSAFEELKALLDGSAFSRLQENAERQLREFQESYPLLTQETEGGSIIVITFDESPAPKLQDEMAAAGLRDLKGTTVADSMLGEDGAKAVWGGENTPEAHAKALEIAEQVQGVAFSAITTGKAT